MDLQGGVGLTGDPPMHQVSAPMELPSGQNDPTWASRIFSQVLFAHDRSQNNCRCFSSSLCVPFSRAQRHARCLGLIWTGRGRGPAISMRTREQTVSCCPFLQCKHQPAKGLRSTWRGGAICLCVEEAGDEHRASSPTVLLAVPYLAGSPGV